MMKSFDRYHHDVDLHREVGSTLTRCIFSKTAMGSRSIRIQNRCWRLARASTQSARSYTISPAPSLASWRSMPPYRPEPVEVASRTPTSRRRRIASGAMDLQLSVCSEVRSTSCQACLDCVRSTRHRHRKEVRGWGFGEMTHVATHISRFDRRQLVCRTRILCLQ